MAVEVGETLSIVADMREYLASGEENRKVQEILARLQKARETLTTRHETSKHIISQKAEELVRLKDTATPIGSDSEETQSIAKLEVEEKSLRTSIESLEQQIRDLSSQLEIVKQRSADLEKETIGLESSSKQVLKSNNDVFTLFKVTTRLNWDYDAPTVKGNLVRPLGKLCEDEELLPFEYDPRRHTRFEIASRLWDLLDGSDP